MKRHLLTAFLLAYLLPVSAGAQVSVYKTKGVIDALKGRTTFFVIPVWDTAAKSEYEKAIAAVWTLTPIEVGSPQQAQRHYSSSKYAFFTLGHENAHQVDALSQQSSDFYRGAYEFWLGPADGKHEEDKEVIAMALPSYTHAASEKMNRTDVSGTFKARRQELVHQANVQFYTRDTLYGWCPTLVKCYVKRISDLLQDEHTWSIARNRFRVDSAMDNLHKDTLYIPAYVLNYSGPSNLFSKAREVDLSDLKDYYDYPIRVIPDDELRILISHPTRPVYFLCVALLHGTSHHVTTLYEAQSGTTIWTIANPTPPPAHFAVGDLIWLGKRSADGRAQKE